MLCIPASSCRRRELWWKVTWTLKIPLSINQKYFLHKQDHCSRWEDILCTWRPPPQSPRCGRRGRGPWCCPRRARRGAWCGRPAAPRTLGHNSPGHKLWWVQLRSWEYQSKVLHRRWTGCSSQEQFTLRLRLFVLIGPAWSEAEANIRVNNDGLRSECHETGPSGVVKASVKWTKYSLQELHWHISNLVYIVVTYMLPQASSSLLILYLLHNSYIFLIGKYTSLLKYFSWRGGSSTPGIVSSSRLAGTTASHAIHSHTLQHVRTFWQKSRYLIKIRIVCC